jgi:hypothetical protein
MVQAAVLPSLGGCIYPKYFDLEWNEEVQLHDGRVIVVHLKHTYERLYQGITPYGGTILPRDTTLTFDAGGSSGKLTQLFKGFHPLFLGEYDGVWYVILYGSHYYKSEQIPGQNWGLNWYGSGQVARLEGKGFVPISLHDLPAVFTKPNMLYLHGSASEHAQWDGKRVTLETKAEWRAKHRPGFHDAAIHRPPENSIKPANLFKDDRTQGGTSK